MSLTMSAHSELSIKHRYTRVRVNSLMLILAITYIYTVVSNFSIPFLNTIFIVVFFIYALFARPAYAIALWAYFEVYFSYSYLSFENTFQMSMGQFVAIYLGLVSIRLIPKLLPAILHTRIIIKLLLLVLLPVLLALQHQYIAALKVFAIITFSAIFVYYAFERKEVIKAFTLVLIFALFSSYLYNIIWIQIGHLNAAIVDLLGNRYCGVRDANNFSFMSNVALCLMKYTKCFNKKQSTYVTVLLCIGILATISISGICTMCFVLYFISNENDQAILRFSKLLVAIPIAVISLFLLSNYIGGSSGILGSIANRFNTVYEQLMHGDYSDATSSRTYLWGYYYKEWQNMSYTAKAFGAYDVYASLITTRLGSHNTYIDFMMTYGVIGLVSIIIAFFIPSQRKLDKYIWLLKIIVIINIFMRSMDPLSTVLLYFML